MVRRRFGRIRRLPSGKFQASFIDPDGRRQTGPETYQTEADAARYLDRIERDIIPPLKAGAIVLADRYIYTAFARDVAARVLRGLSGGEPASWVAVG